MIATRSPRISASSMKCVVKTTTRPSRAARMMFHVALRLYGSIPEVGSSKKTTGGLPISARQSESFLFWPPDRAPARVCAFSVKPTCCIISLQRLVTSAAGTPRSWA
mmetsp:Transcript_36554/g.78867  ORF Transcript_36554/g.78867 Transcript_36554/m.78867 type:complete len:107 (-) Transcript_36554:472-792(-)